MLFHQLFGAFLVAGEHQEAAPCGGIGTGDLAAVLGGMTDIALIERVAKIEIVRKNDQLAAFLRPEIDRPSRCGKAAIDGWMRILIATGHDADLPHDTLATLALHILRRGRLAALSPLRRELTIC